MKKQTGFGKGLATGLVLSALVATLGISAVAATSNRTIQVEDGFSLSINGASFIPRDANGSKVSVFRYNGTVYAPASRQTGAFIWDPTDDNPNNPYYDSTYSSLVK